MNKEDLKDLVEKADQESKQSKIVAIKERSSGNAEVGDMWLDTEIFDSDTPVSKIIEWASGGDFRTKYGRLIITVPTSEERDGKVDLPF